MKTQKVFRLPGRGILMMAGGALLLCLAVSCDPAIILFPEGGSASTAEWNVLILLSGGTPEAGADFDGLMAMQPDAGSSFLIAWDSGGTESVERPPGIYEFRGAGWMREDLPEGSVLSDTDLMGAVLDRWLSVQARRCVLTVVAEGGGLFLISDSGGRMSAGSFARLLAARGMGGDSGEPDLLVLDGGYSSSLELLTGLVGMYAPADGAVSGDGDVAVGSAAADSPRDETLILASPGPFPVRGRNYADAFTELPDAAEPDAARYLAESMAQRFLEDREDTDPGSQTIIDGGELAHLSIAFEVLARALDSDLASATESDGSEAEVDREDLRRQLFYSRPAYYLTPGTLHLDLVSSLKVLKDSCSAPALLESAVSCASVLSACISYSSVESPSADGDCSFGMGLLFVPLYASGEPDPRYPDYYYRADDSPLEFSTDSAWVPDPENASGVLYRLWLEPD